MLTPYKAFGVECGAGWKDLYQPLIDECNKRGVEVQQIKEKFGGLRFYTDCVDVDLQQKIFHAESTSYSVCETCGKPGTPTKSGWLKTLCEEHQQEREARLKGTSND
jgi:hypothetical protein